MAAATCSVDSDRHATVVAVCGSPPWGNPDVVYPAESGCGPLTYSEEDV